jgi:hypothetical protein
MNKSEGRGNVLVIIAMVILSVFYAFYFPGKFMKESSNVFTDFFFQVRRDWGWITFLQFLATCSIFVDIVVRWDNFGFREKRVRVLITALLTFAFMAQFLMGFMDIYIAGQVQ